MLHAPALPGSPQNAQSLEKIVEFVLRDAAALAEGGADGLMLENFGDAPFYPGRVPGRTVAQLAIIADRVRRQTKLPLGINVLRNDGRSALAIADSVGASFIRVNVLTGARVTDQGVIEGIAHDLLRDRANCRTKIAIFADVAVKHSAPLGDPRPLEDEVADLVSRGGADAVIVSGAGTGKPVDVAKLQLVKQHAGSVPVLIGSGLNRETASELAAHSDGFIVGSSLKDGNDIANPISKSRVQELRQLIGQGLPPTQHIIS